MPAQKSIPIQDHVEYIGREDSPPSRNRPCLPKTSTTNTMVAPIVIH
ncbi:MAG: hypothetical protein Ct9H300mP8_07260 [Gammaproteobacteria bacterium]|nr:MAG: hypothetical protein Ct9H300mP8_07260 [Gammaproteobacteria bacterium]